MPFQICVIPSLILLLYITPTRPQTTSRLHDTCVYAFSVPKAQLPQSSLVGSGCPGMTELEQEFEGLKRTVRLQQEQMAAMMTQQSLAASEYTKLNSELLRLLKQSINSSDSGSSNTKSSSDNSDTRSLSVAIYIRWGRTVCPAHAQQLYVGYAGGSHYTFEGGGANYLCLPQAPEWTNKTADGFQGGSKVYGTEYELGNLPQFSREHNAGQPLQNHDVPCAACYVPQRSAQIMIPGLVKCPAGWTLEYRGHIVTGHDSHKHSVVYECLDEAPEVVNAGGGNADGSLMYMTEVHCGALPCPKYVNAWELPCVVCTK